MRFQVPQNLDIKDTVVFGLDFRKLLYLGGSLGLVLFLYLFGGGIILSLLIGGPVVVFAALLSFFNFNRQPFVVILQSIFRFLFNKKMYIWKQEGGDVYTERKIGEEVEIVESDSPSARSEKVRKLSANLIFDDSPSQDSIEVNI